VSEEDFLRLIELVKGELFANGLSELSNDRDYLLSPDPSDDLDPLLPPPQQHLIELLEAFERHLVVNTVQTARDSMESINDSIATDFTYIMDVQIVETRRSTDAIEDADGISLLEAPDYSDTLEELRELIGALRNTERGDETQ